MSHEQLVRAIEWGKELIRQYESEGRQVPVYVYERQLQLYGQLVQDCT